MIDKPAKDLQVSASSSQPAQVAPEWPDFTGNDLKPRPQLARNWLSVFWQVAKPHTRAYLFAALAGAAAAYLYISEFCVPLYRVDASLEVQNGAHDYYLETLARVVKSNSLLKSALAMLPEVQRSALLQRPKLYFLRPARPLDQLRDRLGVVTIPQANVIELHFLSPDSQSGMAFVNALLELAKTQNREEADKELVYQFESGHPGKLEFVTILDSASASSRPVSPDAPLVMSATILIAISGCLIFVLLQYWAATTFTGPDSVSKALKLRLLGVLPKSEGGEGAIGEWVRYLRSSLLYFPGDRPTRSVTFTSVDSDDGSARVILKLGVSLAATGRRILLIDGNMRRPSLHPLMQVANGIGLADLLRSDSQSEPAALSTFVLPALGPNIFVMPPGTPGNDVPELLAGKKLAPLLRELTEYFDFVLIEAPNLLAYADARNLSRAVDGVVLVVESKKTKKSAAQQGRDQLLQDGAVILGAVLIDWNGSVSSATDPATATNLS